jgi:hypothetical protein
MSNPSPGPVLIVAAPSAGGGSGHSSCGSSGVPSWPITITGGSSGSGGSNGFVASDAFSSDVVFPNNALMRRDLTVKGALVVQGELTVRGEEHVVISVDWLKKQSLQELLCCDSEAMRKVVKIILEKQNEGG